MAILIGKVKQLLGNVVARDTAGNERVLNIGDEIFFGEVIVALTPDSKAIIDMVNGKEVTILGNNEYVMNDALIDAGSMSNVLAGISDLQKAIMEGGSLNELEETAAGRGSVDSIDGTSLSSENFTDSGSISNVFEGFGDLNNVQSQSQPPLTVSVSTFSSEQQVTDSNININKQPSTPAPEQPSTVRTK